MVGIQTMLSMLLLRKVAIVTMAVISTDRRLRYFKCGIKINFHFLQALLVLHQYTILFYYGKFVCLTLTTMGLDVIIIMHVHA